MEFEYLINYVNGSREFDGGSDTADADAAAADAATADAASDGCVSDGTYSSVNTFDERVSASQVPTLLRSPCATYHIIKKLGRGRTSVVYEARMTAIDPKIACENDRRVAIKVFLNTRDRESRYWHNEIAINMRVLSSHGERNSDATGVTRFFGFFSTIIMQEYYPVIYPVIVMELGVCTLRDLIIWCADNEKRISPVMAKGITKSIFRGLKCLHSAGIIHTDIKPDNIYLTASVADIVNGAEFETMIGDLGTSVIGKGDSSNGVVGTWRYMAPELIYEMPYDTAIDVWSACMIYVELFTTDELIDIHGENDTLYGADIDTYIYNDDMTVDCGICGVSTCVGDCDEGKIIDFGTLGGDATADACVDTLTDTPVDEESPTDSVISYDDEVLQINHAVIFQKLFGKPPKSIYTKVPKIYDTDGNVHGFKIAPISLFKFLENNYEMHGDKKKWKEMHAFVMKGFIYDPTKRITAEKAFKLL